MDYPALGTAVTWSAQAGDELLGHHQVVGQVAVMHVGHAAVALVEPYEGGLEGTGAGALHPQAAQRGHSSAASTARKRDTPGERLLGGQGGERRVLLDPAREGHHLGAGGVERARSSARADAALYSTIITPDAAGVPSPRNGFMPVYAGSASIVSRARLSCADWASASTSASNDCTR